MGFYVEYSLDEAIAFIDKKEKVLNEELESLRNQASKIKAHIKLVLEVRNIHLFFYCYNYFNHI